MSTSRSQSIFERARAVIPGGVNSPVRACRSVGAEELAAQAKRRTGVGFGETTYDGKLTVDEVFCLGNCALGPAVQVGGKVHGRVTPARLDALLGEAR